jgi:hypothetical protein
MTNKEESKKQLEGKSKITSEEMKILNDLFRALAQIEVNVYKKGGSQ